MRELGNPLPYFGWKAKVEQYLRAKGMRRLANFMGWLDERGMG